MTDSCKSSMKCLSCEPISFLSFIRIIRKLRFTRQGTFAPIRCPQLWLHVGGERAKVKYLSENGAKVLVSVG